MSHKLGRTINVAGRLLYRSEIDGLRGVAIVAVIINHINKELLPSGYLGVDIFFVISGYVITASLWDSPREGLSDFLLHFYTRRVKRLVPALALCVLVTSVLVCLFNPNPEISLKTGIASLFGLSNLYLLRASTDYFAPSSELNVFTNTWSLGVEEQFYFVYPLLLWLSVLGQATKRNIQQYYWTVGVFSVLSLFAFIYLHGDNRAASFFLMPTRFWELGLGCLVFLFLRNNSATSIRAVLNPTVIFGLLVAAMFLPFAFSVAATIVVVALTVMLIAALRPQTGAYVILVHPYVVYIGLISYSLYLWHWTVLSISRWTIGVHLWSVPLQIFLMFLLAKISYDFVEKPLRSSGWSTTRWMPIVYGLSASVSVSVFLLILLMPAQGWLYTGIKVRVESDTASNVTIQYSDVLLHVKELAAKCNMTPQMLTGKERKSQPLVNELFFRNCIQSPLQSKKFLLVGDSFANASAPHVAILARKLGYDFRMIFGYGCPYPLLYEDIKSRTLDHCRQVDVRLLQ